ncbi:unnamed protein product, partial [Sphacelaria rigidula]
AGSTELLIRRILTQQTHIATSPPVAARILGGFWIMTGNTAMIPWRIYDAVPTRAHRIMKCMS